MQTYKRLYEKIVSWENLLAAYKTFRKGKRFKDDVLKFEYNYETELLKLQSELIEHTYTPLPAHRFFIYEPKKREIVVACVRDRVVHHALCRVIEPIFDKRLTKKQTVSPLKCGIDFLGFRIFSTHRLLRKENVKRFCHRLKRMKKQFERKQIAIGKIGLSIRGWIAHAKQGNTYGLRKRVLRDFVLVSLKGVG